MMKRHSYHLTLLAAAAMAQAGIAFAQAADNSKANSAAENSSNPASIADGQSNRREDLALTQKIRRSVIADQDLSVDAHNVKIVTLNGRVTLNGVVRSDAEKASVAAKATIAAGVDNVVNDLKVVPPG
jgi:hyperosmotically inducible protein